MKSICFGGEKHDRLEIIVLGYERCPTGDYHDDNWLSVRIKIKAGAFEGEFPAAFLTSELADFHAQLAALYQTLKGKAEFIALESQLSLALVSNSSGHIHLSGEALDQSGVGNKLEFSIAFDQTCLQSSVRSLGEALAVFPVRA